MQSHFISELLVLFLLLLSSSRIIFIKKVQADSLAIVPLVAFLISMLNILAWGLSFLDLVISATALFVAIWNVRALLRFLSHLVIDHYGPWFILISIVNMLLVIAVSVLAIYFRPALVNFKKYGVRSTSVTYHGSFAEGFVPVGEPFQISNAQIWTYEKTEPPEEDGEKKIILFIPSKLSAPEVYEGFYAKLARDGYIVHVAEFNTAEQKYFNSILDFRAFRRFGFGLLYHRNGEAVYKEFLKLSRDKLKAEVDSLISIVAPDEKNFVFVVTEDDVAGIFDEVQETNSRLVDGFFALTEASFYETPFWGPVENTEPLTARYLGVEADRSMYMSSHLASELEKAFSMAQQVTALSTGTPQNAVDENSLQ